MLSFFIAKYVIVLKKRHLHDTLSKLISLSPRWSRQIPVTLVTGFLGAGKTVLLNRLLANPGGRRICVIENELGTVSIDHSLLAPASNSSNNNNDGQNTNNNGNKGGVLVLKNGCVCCSASGSGDELVRTLDKLLSLSSISSGDVDERGRSIKEPAETAFDYVVIETSGVVDPAPLVQAFFKSALASGRYQLDSVITVVDAKNIGRQLDSNGFLSRAAEAGQQVAYADVVLINKVDIASEEQRISANKAVRKINPTARVFECSNCDVDVEMLLDSHSFDVSKAGALIEHQLQEEYEKGLDVNSSSRDDSGKASSSSTTRKLSARHSGISSMTLDAHNLSIPLAELIDWLKTLVASNSESLYRIKGLLHVVEGQNLLPTLFAVHGVHTDLQGARVELAEAAAAQVKAAIVLIGRGLDSAELQRQFREKVLAFALPMSMSLPSLPSCCDLHAFSDAAVSGLDLKRRRRTGSGPALVSRGLLSFSTAMMYSLFIFSLFIQPSSSLSSLSSTSFLSKSRRISGFVEPEVTARTIFLQTSRTVATTQGSNEDQFFSWPIIIPEGTTCSRVGSVSVDLVGLEHQHAHSASIFLRKGNVVAKLASGAGAAESISSSFVALEEPSVLSFYLDPLANSSEKRRTISSYTGGNILQEGHFDSEEVLSNATLSDIQGPWQLEILTLPIGKDIKGDASGVIASISTWILYIACDGESIAKEFEAGVIVRVRSYPKLGRLFAARNITTLPDVYKVSPPAPSALYDVNSIAQKVKIPLQADYEQCIDGHKTSLTKFLSQVECSPSTESTTYSSALDVNEQDKLIPLDWTRNRHSVVYERRSTEVTGHDEFSFSLESSTSSMLTVNDDKLYTVSLDVGVNANQPASAAANRIRITSRKESDAAFIRLHKKLGGSMDVD